MGERYLSRAEVEQKLGKENAEQALKRGLLHPLPLPGKKLYPSWQVEALSEEREALSRRVADLEQRVEDLGHVLGFTGSFVTEEELERWYVWARAYAEAPEDFLPPPEELTPFCLCLLRLRYSDVPDLPRIEVPLVACSRASRVLHKLPPVPPYSAFALLLHMADKHLRMLRVEKLGGKRTTGDLPARIVALLDAWALADEKAGIRTGKEKRP